MEWLCGLTKVHGKAWHGRALGFCRRENLRVRNMWLASDTLCTDIPALTNESKGVFFTSGQEDGVIIVVFEGGFEARTL